MLKKFIFSVATPIACALSIVSTNVQAQGPCCPPPPCSEDPCCTPAWFTDALIVLGAASIAAIAGVATGYALRDHSSSGDDGPKGVTGDQGVQGPQGDIGAVGPQGVIGLQGVEGQQGLSGPAGTPGAPGPTGPTGPVGNVGATGNGGPQGATGPTGAAIEVLDVSSLTFSITPTFTSPDTTFATTTPAIIYVTQPNGLVIPNDITDATVPVTLTAPFYAGNYVVTLYLPSGPTGLTNPQVITVNPTVGGVPQPEVTFISDYTGTISDATGVTVSVNVPIEL